MPKALIITRVFPPLNSAGASIRLVKMIKYIHDVGWDCVVITQDPDHPVVGSQRLSGFLESELPESTEVIRVPAPFQTDRWFDRFLRKIFGCSSFPWIFNVTKMGLKRASKEIDLVFAVTPPFTTALASWWISIFRWKPLVLDMKDDWVGSPDFQRKKPIQQKIEQLIEETIVRSSSAVILVTQQSFDLYQNRYARLKNPERFHFIPNGCDLSEYQSISQNVQPKDSKCFRIVSAAWGYRKDYRDLTPFLKAIACLLERCPHFINNSEIVFLGESLSRDYEELIDQYHLRPIIREPGVVDRATMMSWLRSADLFFLIQPAGNKTAISGTLYEYWAVGGAPVLLISEDGASSWLVNQYHLGSHFGFNEIEAISQYLEKLYLDKGQERPIQISRKGITNFDRRKLALDICNIFSELLP